MNLALTLDVVVAALLVMTILYAGMLNRRLAGLRSNRAELELLIQSFNESCARAEAGAKSLRSATDEATRLQQYLDRSQTLRDDLSYLIDRGGNLADRLEGGVRTARTEAKARPEGDAPRAAARAPLAAERPPVDRAAPAERGGLDRQVERPVGNDVPETPPARLERPDRPVRDRAAMRQNAMSDANLVAAAVAEAQGQAPRSKAERELLQALRAKR